MDLQALHQIYVVALLALGNGTITAGLTQVLKLPYIKVPAKKYPVPVAIVLSLVLSAVAVFGLHMIVLTGWVAWLTFSGATLFVATESYNLVKNTIKQLNA